MTDHDWEASKAHIEQAYNPPPPVPRNEMWEHIEGRLNEPVGESDVVSLAERRSAAIGPARSGSNHWRRNTLLAAAAGLVLWIGFGWGRATSSLPPNEGPSPAVAQGTPSTQTLSIESQPETGSATRFATARHLAATRSLLTSVGHEAEDGSLDPNVAPLATLLLTQTRLMLDSSPGLTAEMVLLLEDLELVLVQVVHASKAGATNDSEVGRMELQQLTQGLQDNNVLPRIQHLLPPVMAGAADD